MTVEEIAAWVGVATSIGFVSLAVWFCKWLLDRLRWQRFERSISKWVRDTLISPDDLSADEWKTLCAIELRKADFTPGETLKLLDLAVLIAKGQSSLAIGGDIAKGTERE